jgi:hypothetical protein
MKLLIHLGESMLFQVLCIGVILFYGDLILLGPNSLLDRWWQTYSTHQIYHSNHTTFGKDFHTYGLEWSQSTPALENVHHSDIILDRLLTYVDSQLLQILYVPFKEPRWLLGNFPLQGPNGTTLVDPWSQTGHGSTPFDQEFYLILSLAVGGTNGYFPDNMAAKPWVDASPTAMYEFWQAKDQWLPTWGAGLDRAFQVKSVKMWQQCD